MQSHSYRLDSQKKNPSIWSCFELVYFNSFRHLTCNSGISYILRCHYIVQSEKGIVICICKLTNDVSSELQIRKHMHMLGWYEYLEGVGLECETRQQYTSVFRILGKTLLTSCIGNQLQLCVMCSLICNASNKPLHSQYDNSLLAIVTSCSFINNLNPSQ